MDYADRGHLQQLFTDTVVDVALIILDVDGKVLTWNAGAHAMLGYTEAEVVGQHFSFVYTQSDVSAGMPLMALNDALAKGRHEDAGVRLRKDGTEVKTESVLIPLYDSLKKLVAFGNLTREIDRSARLVAPKATPGALAPTGKKVLLVDDDDAFRGAAISLLTSLGYQVVAAPGAVEAVAILARVADVDVLITDVVMPGGMSGGELAKQARILRPDIKILFSSGYFEGALVSQGTISDGTHFLVKPYRKKDLALKMNEVLNAVIVPV
jgi:PAS domain S-box-containing protein